MKNKAHIRQQTEARARLISALWKLKKNIEKHCEQPAQPIHFTRMLKDPDYREQVIHQAIQCEQLKIHKAGLHARQLDTGESLMVERMPSRVQLDQAPDFQAYEKLDDAIRRQRKPEPGQRVQPPAWLGFSILVFSVLVAGLAITWLLAGSGLIRNEDVLHVSEPILQDTVWKKGQRVVLEEIIYVESGAVLIIEPGVRIEGQTNSALVITQGSRVQARGTASEPIVFTSAQPVGQRLPGDWGGLVLLGSAPVNMRNAHIEGLPANDLRGQFGGNDPRSSCGLLEYVRIEFAGYEIYADNELNGLTLGGCGSGTLVRHVQVHRARDDGIELFGGTVNLSHILITGAGDDGLDWDLGWQGKAQFVIIQQYAGIGDNAMEGDNHPERHDARPASSPEFYNLTLLNSGGGRHRAMLLRRGTAGKFRNVLMAGYPARWLDIRHERTAENARRGLLQLSHWLSDSEAFPPGEREDDDGGFDEQAYVQAPERHILMKQRLGLAQRSLHNPRFSPTLNSPATRKGAPIPEDDFWNEAARFIGAVRPGTARPWHLGWTDYPEN